LGAELSGAADHVDRAVSCWRANRYDWAIVADGMRVSLRQPIIIENVTGAGGTIGVGRVARAIPDGYTLSVGFLGTHVLNGAIYMLQYDVLKDFEPVALLASNPQLIVAKNAILRKA